VKSAMKTVVDQMEEYERRAARESARLGRLPGISNSPGNINAFPFPRQSPGQISGSFRFQYSEGSMFGNFREEFEIIITDSIHVGKEHGFPDHSKDASSFDQLYELNLDQERRREQWLKDLNWSNYKILLEDRPLSERIDSVFLARAIAGIFQEAGIERCRQILNLCGGKHIIIPAKNSYLSGLYLPGAFRPDIDSIASTDRGVHTEAFCGKTDYLFIDKKLS